MIYSVSQQNINFTGKTFFRSGRLDDFCDDIVDKSKNKIKKSAQEISSEHFRAYANIDSKKVNLIKNAFGYQAETNSISLHPYKASLAKNAGFSTETGGFGGGYLHSSLDVPLSTTDIHTCAGMNLVNEKTNEHIFLHVFDATTTDEIVMFIKEKFPKFNRLNLIPGDLYQTNKTVNNILSAVAQINPKAEKQFYHFSSDAPEVVAHKGALSYVENQNAGNVSFEEVDQYFRPPSYD
jgi:hypothetical protein